MATVTLTKGATMVVDDEDAHLFTGKWHLGSHGYAMRTSSRAAGKRVAYLAHRIILDATPAEYIDHINGDKLDNRRRNLRIATMSQNLANAKQFKNNTSGYRGVTYHKDVKKWVAQFHSRTGDRERNIYLGIFATKEEAAKTRAEFMRERFGEFAREIASGTD